MPAPANTGGVPSAEAQLESVRQKWHATIQPEDTWHVISAKWFKDWCQYVGFNPVKPDEPTPPSSKTGQPGAIDNSHLSGKQPYTLKQQIREGIDYNIIHAEVWDLLHGWYGGGPSFPRGVKLVGIQQETRIDMYPLYVNLVWLNEDGTPNPDTTKQRALPSNSTFRQLLDQLQKELPLTEKKSTATKDASASGDDDAAIVSLDDDDNDDATGLAAGVAAMDVGGERSSDDEEDRKSDRIRLWVLPDDEDDEDADEEAPGAATATAGDDNDTSSTDAVAGTDADAGADPGTAAADDAAVDTADATGAPADAVPTEDAAADAAAGDDVGDVPDAQDTADAQADTEPTATTDDKDKKEKKKKKWLALRELHVQVGTMNLPAGTTVFVDVKNPDGDFQYCPVKKDWQNFEIGDTIDAQDTVRHWYESTVVGVNWDEKKVKVHYKGWAERWDEWLPMDSDRLARQNTHTTEPYSGRKTGFSSYRGWNSQRTNEVGTPPAPGAVGLYNLGNTCFMNSTIQCLSNSPYFTNYFITDKYSDDINRDNPLGWKGRIADEYGALMKDIWSGKYRIVAPRKLKQAIQEFQPRFAGYNQHDSSELLSFLLDGLHEDVNKVLKKPPTNTVESDGRPDAVVAKEAWDTYLLRNQSAVVDLFQGQIKSKLVCPHCDRVSITFDPVQFLTVPLPDIADHVQEVFFVPADSSKAIQRVHVLTPRVALIGVFKQALSTLLDVPAKRLVVCDVWNNGLHKVFGDEDGVGDFSSNDKIYVYECPELDEIKEKEVFFAQFIHQTHDGRDKTSLPFPFPMSKDEANEMNGTFAYQRAIKAVSRVTKEDIDPENLPFLLYYSSYAKPIDQYDDEVKNEDDELLDLGLKSEHSRYKKHFFTLKWKEDALLEEIPTEDHPSASKEHTIEKPQIDVGQCIAAYNQEEILGENDKWYCRQCKDFVQATKKLGIWKLPDLLIVHLKRFAYTQHNREKISTYVDFPLENLNMSDHCVNADEKDAVYDLYAVSNHMGGLGGGHYTAYCRNLVDGKWYLHDDSSVSPVSTDRVKSSAAYVLFYRRRTPSAVASQYGAKAAVPDSAELNPSGVRSTVLGAAKPVDDAATADTVDAAAGDDAPAAAAAAGTGGAAVSDVATGDDAL